MATTTEQNFYDLVAEERDYQRSRWGTTDQFNNVYNWAGYIGAYTNRNLIGNPFDEDRIGRFKQDMIKVAALALAAYENL